MQDAKHPIWAIIRTAVVLTALAVTLYVTAEHFDETETRTITTMFIALLGAEGLTNAFAARR
jgi:hypothetical protein